MLWRRVLVRHRAKLVAVVFLVVIFTHIAYIRPQKSLVSQNNSYSEQKAPVSGDKDGIKESIQRSIRDYRVFFDGLEEYKITAPSIKGQYKDKKAPEVFSTADDILLSKEVLENVLDIPDETYQQLKTSHSRYVDEQINKLTENYGLSTFGNILKTDPEWGTYQGSAGYVMVGGHQFSWLSYLNIRQLRSTGSKLPVELFIASDAEYEPEFCEKVLPRLNARCNRFNPDFIKELGDRFNLGGFQFKMLAVLSSRFENVMYLDSDNLPARNPDGIFESDLYKKHQMILWPDAWARTTNPKFYEIAGIDVKPNKIRYSAYDKKEAEKAGESSVRPPSAYDFTNSNFHDFEGTIPNPTSEAGAFVINKTSHLKTLLLCLYYNVFGPDYYYPLFTQGSAGEGDKETFIAAAHVMNEPWFQTLKQFKWVGYFRKSKGGFDSKALGHYDPVQSATDADKDIDFMFMHLSYPKYYWSWLSDNHELYDSDEHVRMYESIYDNVGYDFDLRVLYSFTLGLCPNLFNEDGSVVVGPKEAHKNKDYMGPYLRYAQPTAQISALCKELFIPHIKWLLETTKYPNSISPFPGLDPIA